MAIFNCYVSSPEGIQPPKNNAVGQVLGAAKKRPGHLRSKRPWLIMSVPFWDVLEDF